MSSTDLLMRCCSFSSWRSPATDVRQTMPSNRFESQVIHSQFPGAVPFSRKQPPQPDFPKVPTGFPKVLREFSKVLTGFSKVLTVFPKVPTVFPKVPTVFSEVPTACFLSLARHATVPYVGGKYTARQKSANTSDGPNCL